MAIIKQFLSGQRVLLSFTLSINAAYGARKAFLVAEFNDWRPMEMIGDKTGGFSLTVEVDVDKPDGYEYRFILQDEDGSERFTNDWHADEYRQNEFGTDNSVVHVLSYQQGIQQELKTAPEPEPLDTTPEKVNSELIKLPLICGAQGDLCVFGSANSTLA